MTLQLSLLHHNIRPIPQLTMQPLPLVSPPVPRIHPPARLPPADAHSPHHPSTGFLMLAQQIESKHSQHHSTHWLLELTTQCNQISTVVTRRFLEPHRLKSHISAEPSAGLLLETRMARWTLVQMPLDSEIFASHP